MLSNGIKKYLVTVSYKVAGALKIGFLFKNYCINKLFAYVMTSDSLMTKFTSVVKSNLNKQLNTGHMYTPLCTRWPEKLIIEKLQRIAIS